MGEDQGGIPAAETILQTKRVQAGETIEDQPAIEIKRPTEARETAKAEITAATDTETPDETVGVVVVTVLTGLHENPPPDNHPVNVSTTTNSPPVHYHHNGEAAAATSRAQWILHPPPPPPPPTFRLHLKDRDKAKDQANKHHHHPLLTTSTAPEEEATNPGLRPRGLVAATRGIIIINISGGQIET